MIFTLFASCSMLGHLVRMFLLCFLPSLKTFVEDDMLNSILQNDVHEHFISIRVTYNISKVNHNIFLLKSTPIFCFSFEYIGEKRSCEKKNYV